MKALQIPRKVRIALAERCGGLCEVRHECQGRPFTQAHHRRPRGMGGSRRTDTNGLANLMAACNECHAWIEANRDAALVRGWLVAQQCEPTRVVCEYSNPSILRVPCLLDDDGGIRTATDDEELVEP